MSTISYDEFKKMDIRIGKIVSAEEIPKSRKLIKLLVDLGEDEPRQLVAGIKEYYSPAELVGRHVVVLANLEPVKLMGVESNGMILAGDVDGKPVLLAPDAEVPPGTIVR